jgi:hypothetical protein
VIEDRAEGNHGKNREPLYSSSVSRSSFQPRGYQEPGASVTGLQLREPDTKLLSWLNVTVWPS